MQCVYSGVSAFHMIDFDSTNFILLEFCLVKCKDTQIGSGIVQRWRQKELEREHPFRDSVKQYVKNFGLFQEDALLGKLGEGN